jgi:hypothetical protein
MDKQYTFDEINALIAAGKIKSMTLEATVIRANGDIEPQGIIAAKHRNILKHILLQVRIKLDRLYVYRQRLKNGKRSHECR